MSLFSLPVFLCRGGGWQRFTTLPQPALLQGLGGPRSPTDHQRQPLPPHHPLWVHSVLRDTSIKVHLCLPPSHPSLIPSPVSLSFLIFLSFSSLMSSVSPLSYFSFHANTSFFSPSIVPFLSVTRLLSSQPEVSTATTLLSQGLHCLDALPPQRTSDMHSTHRYTQMIRHHCCWTNKKMSRGWKILHAGCTRRCFCWDNVINTGAGGARPFQLLSIHTWISSWISSSGDRRRLTLQTASFHSGTSISDWFTRLVGSSDRPLWAVSVLLSAWSPSRGVESDQGCDRRWGYFCIGWAPQPC